MKEYFDLVMENMKIAIGKFFFETGNRIKGFFNKFIWIMKVEWGWEEWTLVGFFSFLSLVIGLQF